MPTHIFDPKGNMVFIMELFVLIMLYYLSQNPDFERSVQPLLSELKNSEKALKFLDELSQFSKLFSGINGKNDRGRDESSTKSQEKSANNQQAESSSPSSTSGEAKANPSEASQSPISGIANGFIEELLESYFKHLS